MTNWLGLIPAISTVPPHIYYVVAAAIFIAFAPKDDPKIALSVYVENGGQGARVGAAIAGLMIEKYLKGCTDRSHMEEYVLNGEFIY